MKLRIKWWLRLSDVWNQGCRTGFRQSWREKYFLGFLEENPCEKIHKAYFDETRSMSKMAADLGFEPRQNDPESFVLPLH